MFKIGKEIIIIVMIIILVVASSFLFFDGFNWNNLAMIPIVFAIIHFCRTFAYEIIHNKVNGKFDIIEQKYRLHNVACKCKTSDGKTVWVYMSVYEYNKYIDSDAKISNSFNADYDVKYYSKAKRIHGTARKADSLCEGLSSDTGTMILYFESIE